MLNGAFVSPYHSTNSKNAIFFKYCSITKGDAPVELYTDISVFGLRSIYVVVRNKIDLTQDY